MIGKLKKLMVILIITSSFVNPFKVEAQPNDTIIFPDKNLYIALCKCYDWEGDFTKTDASELSKKDDFYISLENSNISNLEGLQYFDNVLTLYLSGNTLKNLKPLSKLNALSMLVISNNSIKGKEFEGYLNAMGKIQHLSILILDNNELTNIDFLKKIGNIKRYADIDLHNNKISDISVLKDTKYCDIELANNRITDVAPLKNLRVSDYLDLRDNCILDYKPIKHVFDEMYKDFDHDNNMERYDYYTNPVNFILHGKKIKFPYLTAYYKCQGYAEAIPLFKALGGSAEYNKKMGILTCKYKEKKLIMKDYSKKYTLNGKTKSMKYEMRRMQYDLAYVSVKDICDILGLKYIVKGERFVGGIESRDAPILVEIKN